MIISSADQDYIDLEKGIKYCDCLGAKSIVVINGTGGLRLDHSISNLRFLKKYYSPERSLAMYTEN